MENIYLVKTERLIISLKKHKDNKEYLRLHNANINPNIPYTSIDDVLGTKEYPYEAYNVAERKQYVTDLGKIRKNKYLNIVSSKNVIGTIINQSTCKPLE